MAQVNLTKEVFEKLNTILSGFNAYLNSAPFTAAYPVVTFALLSSSKVNQKFASFGSETETFQIQISIFDDNDDCERLIQQQADIEDALRAGDWGNNKVSVSYLGAYGPTYIAEEKNWQFSKTYEVTLNRSAH